MLRSSRTLALVIEESVVFSKGRIELEFQACRNFVKRNRKWRPRSRGVPRESYLRSVVNRVFETPISNSTGRFETGWGDKKCRKRHRIPCRPPWRSSSLFLRNVDLEYHGPFRKKKKIAKSVAGFRDPRYLELGELERERARARACSLACSIDLYCSTASIGAPALFGRA